MKDIYIHTEYDHRSDRDKIKVPEVQKDREEHENLALRKDFKHVPSTMVGTLMAFVDKTCVELADLTVTPEIIHEIEPSIHLFEKLKNLLTMLTMQDYSQHIDFAAGLSHVWHELIEYCIPSTIGRLKSAIAKTTIKQLIKNIKEYPKNDEHSLGYYLTHYAGDNWLPFPFMQLLRTLHEEYAANGSSSTLGMWIHQLSIIMKELSPINNLNDSEKK
ncbi:MAG: hypothetical protein HY860_00015 [Chlamydiales bacterium]|nr:hypothetical protein [Chlamydiales bacterium]